MYKYRVVVCGECGHHFMWLENQLQCRIDHYENIDGERGTVAKCPMCSKNLVVFPKKLEGTSTDRLDGNIRYKDSELGI